MKRRKPKASPKELAISAAVLLLGRRRRHPRLKPGERERVVPAGAPSPRAELLVIWLLLAAAICGAGFIAVYALDRTPHPTQFLGLSLGLALAFVAAALIVIAKHLIVSEELEDDYPAAEHPEEQEQLVQVVDESGSRFTRGGLVKLAGAAAGGSLGLAFVTPLVSLGPVFDVDPLYGTPWRRGRGLVDEQGRPWHASDIEEKDFYTAFPAGTSRDAREELGAAVVLVRLPKGTLRLPPENAGFDADGIVAFSKICTHAGCAISLYRAPLFAPNEPGAALVCPCHYSTFDPSTGGTVTFGPAGRKLPMLPLAIDPHGFLRAAGNFDEPVGASWWGVRLRRPNPR